MRQILVAGLMAGAVGWGTAIVAAPLAHGGEEVSTRLAAVTYLVGAIVCHQRPDRSFHLAGAQLPVCARCAALYWGGAVGLAAWLMVRRRRSRAADPTRFARALLVLGLPLAVTWAASAAGIWDASNALRAISSAPFGAALGALLAAVALGDLR